MNCHNHLYSGTEPRTLARRWFLQNCGVGLGSLAMQGILGRTQGNGIASASATPGHRGIGPHFAPKAKNVIFLFMAGAPSHLELFDYKPMLEKHHGQMPPAELIKDYRAAFINPNSKLLAPKFKFHKHGQCGTELSTLLPYLAGIVDQIAVVKSLVTDAFNHAPAQILMSTGSQQFGKPSLGAWTLYGLGSEAEDLPGFVVFSTGKKGPSGGNSNWGSGFLPTVHQGVTLRASGDPVLYLANPPGISPATQRKSLDVIQAMNQIHLESVGDSEVATRMHAYEMAYRMQASAPEAMDLSHEPEHILQLYGAKRGVPSFANTCILARRLIERGVRFVEIFHEAWDQHGNLYHDLQVNCADTDQASAALVKDLKQRGLLEDTLVIWGGEFGRTPMVEGGSSDGRDHHPNAFTMWLAGGGIKPGISLGQTDDFGFDVVSQRIHVHDLHATIQHLLGFDPLRFSYKLQGLDQRLIGVEPARVVKELLA